MSFHAALRTGVHRVFLRCEEALDAPFGGADNPLRHLGAMGLYLLWVVVGDRRQVEPQLKTLGLPIEVK